MCQRRSYLIPVGVPGPRCEVVRFRCLLPLDRLIDRLFRARCRIYGVRPLNAAARNTG